MGALSKVTFSKLFVLYFIFSVLYIALSFTTLLPSIFIDELLYSKLAENLWSNHTLLFRGNNFHFYNVAYSIIISPFYCLPSKEYIFAAIKIFNSLIYCLALFPIYSFAKKVLNNERQSLIVAILSLISSGYFTSHIMIENVFYPLFWSIIYFLYCIFIEDKKRYQILFIVLSFIALFTKPTIFPVFVVYFLIIMKEIIIVLYNKSSIRSNVIGKYYISIIGIIIAFISYTLITFQNYESYVTKSSFDLSIFLQSFFSNISFLSLFCFSLPIIIFIINLIANKKMRFSNFNILSLVLIIGVISIIAYADVVTRDFRIHERYFLILYPIMFISLLNPLKKTKIKFRLLSILIVLTIVCISYLLLPTNKFFIIPDAPNFAIINFFGKYLSYKIIKVALVICSLVCIIIGVFYNKTRTTYIMLAISLIYFSANLVLNNVMQFQSSKTSQLSQYNAIRALSSEINLTKDQNVLFVYNGVDTKLLWNSEFLMNGQHRVALLDSGNIPDGWDNKIIQLNNKGEVTNQDLKNVDFIVNYSQNIKFKGEIIASHDDISLTKVSDNILVLKSKDNGRFSDGWIGRDYEYKVFNENSVVRLSITMNGYNIPDGVGELSGVIKSKQLSADYKYSIRPRESKIINLELRKEDVNQPFDIMIENQTFVPDLYYKNGDSRELSVILENIDIKTE